MARKILVFSGWYLAGAAFLLTTTQLPHLTITVLAGAYLAIMACWIGGVATWHVLKATGIGTSCAAVAIYKWWSTTNPRPVLAQPNASQRHREATRRYQETLRMLKESHLDETELWAGQQKARQ